MNDYKELMDVLRSGAWSVYKINSPAAMCETIYNAQIADAIEQLVKERDAAVKDLFEEADSRFNTCLYCKKDADCVLDCDNALWEWRGVQE